MMVGIMEDAPIIEMDPMVHRPGQIKRLAALSLRQKKIEIVGWARRPVVVTSMRMQRAALVDRVAERIGVPIPDMPRH
jgi:hypothetical protein